jgi:tRNA threonylcarbamoyladenosine biosynthesis protein TsaB
MNVLALDTSTDILAVALATGEGWSEASLDLGLRHAERLMDLVESCLSRAGLASKDLDLLACAEGPGSFTGLRIGMATVKGMALALGKPWVAVPTLDCLAYGLDAWPGLVVPVVDGKKGRVYSALYRKGRRGSDWLDLPLPGLLSLLDDGAEVLVTGPDADLLEEAAMERGGICLDGRARWPAARALAILARARFEAEGGARDDLGPLYLRPSEAEETAGVEGASRQGDKSGTR